MRTVLNNLVSFAAAFIFWTALPASATEVARVSQKSAAFKNYSSANSVLLLSEAGQGLWVNDLKPALSKTYAVEAACGLKTQNTVVMGEPEGGMTLAYPYFVGVGKVCWVDEATNSIRLISNFKSSLPRNSFSVSFAGQDANALYFLINGRPYPEGTAGYISALVINKVDKKVSVRSLLSDVPGFSAAMIYDGAQIWVATWLQKNDIYKISSAQLIALIQKGSTAKFSDLAVKAAGGFEGMSSFALKNETSFLFYNEGIDSFKLNALNSSVTPVQPSCEPIAGEKNAWLSLCDGTRLEVMDISN